MSDYKDIWSADEDGGQLSEEQLMAYLEGRLPEEERRAVEELLSQEGMESDALEGLQGISADEARNMKRKVNADLQKVLGKKRRGRRGIGDQRWTLTTVVVLLLLLVICFAVFWALRGK
jgi:anti-sigma factor RsiW